MNRLVERTRADRAALRPVAGPGLAGADSREPLLAIDEMREVVAPRTAVGPTTFAPVANAPATTTAMAPAHGDPLVRSSLPATSASVVGPEPSDVIEARPLSSIAATVPVTAAAGAPADERDRASADAPSSAAAHVAAPARGGPVAVAPSTVRASTPTARPEAESATGEQVIRVHIGRIDVRAPAAVAAPTPKRAAEPLPSVALGRYLEDRGRRR
ncbi:MAG TPA: hypothetical protein VFQ65_08410 [Kofleriaceae bacterium]|nr:hypothetical protein [Kofleriaceae bacterium]